MSFSGKMKEELENVCQEARHCRLAELAGIISVCGRIHFTENKVKSIDFLSENVLAARKCFTILKKTYKIDNVEQIPARELGAGLKIEPTEETDGFRIGNLLLQNTCCKRAFIRGAFLAGGSISDPEKAYHYEVVFSSRQRAQQLKNIIRSFDVDAKIIARKKYYVVYVKEGAQIADLLNIMGAHVALMEFENIRIVKEMRNSINRQVNCEAANISKTVQAATRQIDDILYIRDKLGFEGLEEGLREIAELRVEYPSASLKELGEMLENPLGKSGVNHRLKKLSCIADDLKQLREEEHNDFKED